MTKTQYRAYLQGPEWQAKREEALEYYEERCNRCDMPRWLAEIAYDQDLNVHHVSYANQGYEPMDDLEVLCRRCHDLHTFKRTEIREVKQAVCTACGDRHWNYRCDRCVLCEALRTSFYATLNRLFQPDLDSSGQPYWISFLNTIVIRMVNEGSDHATVIEIMEKLTKLFIRQHAANMQSLGEDIPF